MITRLLTILIFSSVSFSQLRSQEFVAGLSVAGGSSWEIERLPINAPPTEFSGVMAGGGYEVSVLLGYRIDRLTVGVRPAYLRQSTSVFQQVDGDGGPNFRETLYPSAILLPLRADLAFGNQRLRPTFGVGGGFLLSVGGLESVVVPVPEPVLPYVEVMVGVEIETKRFTLRPEFTIRNGTGELFNPGRSEANRNFGGQRWGYAMIGLVVTRNSFGALGIKPRPKRRGTL